MTCNKFTENQKKWLEALESGDFEQTSEYLREGKRFCCLGVATKIVAPRSRAIRLDSNGYSLGHGGGDQDAPPITVRKMNFHTARGGSGEANLARKNDNGWTFADIAEFVRENPHLVFANFDVTAAAK